MKPGSPPAGVTGGPLPEPLDYCAELRAAVCPSTV